MRKVSVILRNIVPCFASALACWTFFDSVKGAWLSGDISDRKNQRVISVTQLTRGDVERRLETCKPALHQ